MARAVKQKFGGKMRENIKQVNLEKVGSTKEGKAFAGLKNIGESFSQAQEKLMAAKEKIISAIRAGKRAKKLGAAGENEFKKAKESVYESLSEAYYKINAEFGLKLERNYNFLNSPPITGISTKNGYAKAMARLLVLEEIALEKGVLDNRMFYVEKTQPEYKGANPWRGVIGV